MSSSATASASPTQVGREWAADSEWAARLARDRATAELHQTPAQRAITGALLGRFGVGKCAAFALTGSTARNQRTGISDLDYHVIGEPPEFRDLPDDIDMVAYDAGTLFEKLRAGDDYAQWTLRYGCILHDTGVFRRALMIISEEQLWPSSDEKLGRIPEHVALARRLVDAGDREGAQAEARATFTSAARAVLLRAGVFPLSRRELPEQLRSCGFDWLATQLELTIHTDVPLERLAVSLDAVASGEPLRP